MRPKLNWSIDVNYNEAKKIQGRETLEYLKDVKLCMPKIFILM